jgi:hypothetical protein
MKNASYRLMSLAVLALACGSIGADGCGFGNPFDKNAWSGITTSGAGANDGCGTPQGQGGGYGGAPGAGGAGVGVSVADVGAGPGGGPGYSPQSCDGDQGIGLPADAYINCVARGLSAVACAELCASVGAACGPIASHPYKSGQGSGQLTYCKNGGPTFTCTYTFANGDGCVRTLTPMGSFWTCVYAGGK